VLARHARGRRILLRHRTPPEAPLSKQDEEKIPIQLTVVKGYFPDDFE
jgi:hypothetical protein